MLKKEKAEGANFSLIGRGYINKPSDSTRQPIQIQETITNLTGFFWGICESCNSAFTISERTRDNSIWLCERCLSREGGDAYEN
jgi:hypothetical protein